MTEQGERRIGKPSDKAPGELQALADAYFQGCLGKPLYNEEGEAVLDKQGLPVMVGVHPPTVSGLALALGFTARKELLCYRGKKKYRETVERARLRVEEYWESQLFDKDKRQGAEFELRSNFCWGQEEDDKKGSEEPSGGVILMPEIREDTAGAKEEPGEGAEG